MDGDNFLPMRLNVRRPKKSRAVVANFLIFVLFVIFEIVEKKLCLLLAIPSTKNGRGNMEGG